MDLQYHDLRPEKSLFARRSASSGSSTDDEVESGRHRAARRTPGPTSGDVPGEFADDIVAANWDSMVFDIGEDPLRRVPMMEPVAGNQSARRYVVGTRAQTPAELLRAARLLGAPSRLRSIAHG